MMLKIQISLGELVDKTTILLIKSKFISETTKSSIIFQELSYLMSELKDIGFWSLDNSELFNQLYSINLELWNLENKIRSYLKKYENVSSGGEYRQLASLVSDIHALNARRASVKSIISNNSRSKFYEIKQYE